MTTAIVMSRAQLRHERSEADKDRILGLIKDGGHAVTEGTKAVLANPITSLLAAVIVINILTDKGSAGCQLGSSEVCTPPPFYKIFTIEKGNDVEKAIYVFAGMYAGGSLLEKLIPG